MQEWHQRPFLHVWEISICVFFTAVWLHLPQSKIFFTRTKSRLADVFWDRAALVYLTESRWCLFLLVTLTLHMQYCSEAGASLRSVPGLCCCACCDMKELTCVGEALMPNSRQPASSCFSSPCATGSFIIFVHFSFSESLLNTVTGIPIFFMRHRITI